MASGVLLVLQSQTGPPHETYAGFGPVHQARPHLSMKHSPRVRAASTDLGMLKHTVCTCSLAAID